MMDRSRRVRSHSENWPSMRRFMIMLWTADSMRPGVGSSMERTRDSQESQIMTMAASRVWGLGPG